MASPEDEALNLLQLQVSIEEAEIAVQRVIQRAIDEDMFTNPPGARLYGSAVLKALREMDQVLLRRVLWPEIGEAEVEKLMWEAYPQFVMRPDGEVVRLDAPD